MESESGRNIVNISGSESESDEVEILDTPSKKRKQDEVDLTGEDSLPENAEEVEEKGEKCPICLCNYEEPSMLDKCFHTFCFCCILQWSHVGQSPKCPLCKQDFTYLIYHIKSEREYQRFYVKENRTIGNTNLLTNDYISEYNKKFGKRKEEPVEQKRSITTNTVPFTPAHTLRRAVYLRGLRAKSKEDSNEKKENGKVLKTERLKFSMNAFKSNVSYWENKLHPWVTRELQALLEEEDVEIFVMFILNALQNAPIESKEIMKGIHDILDDSTDTFVHEFLAFANNPYDMHGYDKIVRYDYSHAKSSTSTSAKPVTHDLTK